jgi:hypothetical protein
MLRTLWTEAFTPYNLYIRPTTCPITKNSTDLTDLIDDINQNLPHDPNIHVSTHDFSTLYTNLEIPTIQTRISTLLQDLFTHAAQREGTPINTTRLLINTLTGRTQWDTTKWRKEPLKKHEFLLDAARLTKWIIILTNNTVVMHNNIAYRQIIGIPMGTNCAVYLANFILFTYEYNHLKKCLINHNWARIEELRYQKRFLDDILTFNNPYYDNYKYDIYPEGMLTLVKEDENLPIHCLDIHFYYNTTDNCLATATHSKDKDPKYAQLPHTRYTHNDSFMHNAIHYNTFTGELHRFHRSNSHIITFTNKTNETIYRMVSNNEYSFKKLQNKLRHHINNHLPFYRHQQAHTAFNYIMKRFHISYPHISFP